MHQSRNFIAPRYTRHTREKLHDGTYGQAMVGSVRGPRADTRVYVRRPCVPVDRSTLRRHSLPIVVRLAVRGVFDAGC